MPCHCGSTGGYMISYHVDESNAVDGTMPQVSGRTFRPPRCPFWIDCELPVLAAIRREVEEALHARQGKSETGGILFGERDLERIHISACRPLRCEHSLGPGFVLSAADERRLGQLISAADDDPELRGLQPLGWYHSHIASRIFLSKRDRQIHARFFGSPFQVALVLQPSSDRATTAGFFFQESSGAMHADSSYEEFVVAPDPAVREARDAGPAVLEMPVAKRASPAVTRAPQAPACPVCGSQSIRRSHRLNGFERVRGAFGYHPYRCHECLSRSFLKSPAGLLDRMRPGSHQRPEERRRAWIRTRRELLLWGGGILGFAAILLYLLRDTGPKQDQP